MAYELTVEQVNSISDVEFAFATTRLLPSAEDIPAEFFSGNIYTKFCESLFFGHDLPCMEIELKGGLEGEKLNRCIRAHVQSYGPDQDHKIAGVGYMLSLVATLYPETNPA